MGSRKTEWAVCGVLLYLAMGICADNLCAAPTDVARELRKVFQSAYGMQPDGVDTRHLAAATADKLGENVSMERLKDSIPERAARDFECYKPIMQAIDGADLSDGVKKLLRLKYGRSMLWPQRQSEPFIGAARECRMVEGLPADTAVVRLSGGEAPLTRALSHAYPGFPGLNPVQKHLILSHLDDINHNLRVEFSVRCAPGQVVQRVPARLGADLADPLLDSALYAIDPALKPAGFAEGEAPVVHHVVPLGDGTVRLWVYRIRPDGDVIMPPASYLAMLSTPDTLDVSNMWLTTLDPIAPLSPHTLILDGNDITDLRPLSRMKRVAHLSLQATRVSDLSPLAGWQLESLDIRDTRVTDLLPLKGMPLRKVVLDRTAVTDLSPLADAPVEHLQLWDTPVTDLRPLARMPLTYLEIKIGVVYDPEGLEVLRRKKTLTAISDFPKKSWFAGYRTRHRRDWVPSMYGHVERVGVVNRLRYGTE